MQLIKNYSRNKKMKTAVTVGIIGYPNVGKSSLINSMKRARSVGVSATPGFTKCLQEVQVRRRKKEICVNYISMCPGGPGEKKTGGRKGGEKRRREEGKRRGGKAEIIMFTLSWVCCSVVL